jgi:hypothetical protein
MCFKSRVSEDQDARAGRVSRRKKADVARHAATPLALLPESGA